MSTDPSLTIDDAYEIQTRQVQAWLSQGQRVAGYKVGLVSRAMRLQMGVDEPDFGHVMNRDIRIEPAIRLSAYLQPLCEAEVGFILGHPLRGPGVHADDVLRATDTVVALVEVVDSRIRDWDLTIVDTVADNASSGGVYLGSDLRSVKDTDLLGMTCTVRIDQQQVAQGVAADVMGHPAQAVAWLVNELGRRGVCVEAGQLVLSGSMTSAVPLPARGGQLSVEFSGWETISLDIEPTASERESV